MFHEANLINLDVQATHILMYSKSFLGKMLHFERNDIDVLRQLLIQKSLLVNKLLQQINKHFLKLPAEGIIFLVLCKIRYERYFSASVSSLNL